MSRPPGRKARNRFLTEDVAPHEVVAAEEGAEMMVEVMVATVLAEVEGMAPMSRKSLPRQQNDDPSVAGQTASSRRL